MKKKTIWTIAIIMGLSFLGLLYLQVGYMKWMAQMKREQFDEAVGRALSEVARRLDYDETQRFLEKELSEKEKALFHNDSTANNADTEFEKKVRAFNPSLQPKGLILNPEAAAVTAGTAAAQKILHDQYLYERSLLDEIVSNKIYTPSDKPLQTRINFKLLDHHLKNQLLNNGVNLDYHFVVATANDKEVYRCSEYDAKGSDITYTQTLFSFDPQQKRGILKIHFPSMNDYIYRTVKFMIPSIVFTLILLVTFIFTIVVVFRQKKLSEIKNDFINNMTHELKTPISSISLAAQMLNDSSVTKTPTMMAHLGSVINSESKRLRFLVDKVLQMSMFDRQKAIYKKKEVDLNEMVENIAHTFHLRVEHTGGKIDVDIEAVDSTIYVDEMHFQNVIFNLLDNAVKYGKPDQPLNLFIKTWNPDEKHVSIMIQDNGLGIKREDVKRVFDKFYRVHTGNVHNVKGFGLGLAYVKQMVDIHDGEIKVESELGKGTAFTIKLPAIIED